MTDQTHVDALRKVDGFLLSRDLMFISKVTGTAAAIGLQIEAIGTISALSARLQSVQPRGVFLDLNCPDFEPNDVIAQWKLRPQPFFVAFGSHVDTARLELAQKAGCNEVLPRSRFSATLPELLCRVFQIAE